MNALAAIAARERLREALHRRADRVDKLGVLLPGVAHQGPFGGLPVRTRHRRGQDIEGAAHRRDVVLAHLAGLHRGRQLGQFRRQCRSGH
jgi:hypothetical protein